MLLEETNMCLFGAPKIPKPEAIPLSPTRDNPAALREAEEQRRRMRMRQGRTSTTLTGPLGDTDYGNNVGGVLGSYSKLGGKT